MGGWQGLASFPDTLITRSAMALKDTALCYKYKYNSFKERKNLDTVKISGRTPDKRKTKLVIHIHIHTHQ